MIYIYVYVYSGEIDISIASYYSINTETKSTGEKNDLKDVYSFLSSRLLPSEFKKSIFQAT